jgi:hypothetical protein
VAYLPTQALRARISAESREGQQESGGFHEFGNARRGGGHESVSNPRRVWKPAAIYAAAINRSLSGT